MENELRTIRTQLRLAMNGVIATSMREKGMKYKLNFGVPVPEIREIAKSHTPDAGLAATLWKEDIREFKILATLLQPAEIFSAEQAQQWVREIPYPEIAEQASRNLFSRIPEAEALVERLLSDEPGRYARMVAFLVGARLLSGGDAFPVSQQQGDGASTAEDRPDFLRECIRSLEDVSVSWQEKQAALLALKFYGRQSSGQADEILNLVSRWAVSDEAVLQEFYNDLKFEFEYYR